MVGYKNRFGYAVRLNRDERGVDQPWTTVIKYDRTGSPSVAHDFGEGQFPSEPVFVPRTAAAAEDDGFVLCVVHDGPGDGSYVAVLDARNLAGPALAHDVDNTYAWNTAIDGTTPNGSAFTDFLNRLNGGVTGVGNCTSADGTTITGGFAGHYDWRLLTSAELQTIVDVTQGKCGGGSGACIDPVFGPTVAGFYWSATTDSDNPFNAWCVDFYGGGVNASVGKINVGYVHAVRTGS